MVSKAEQKRNVHRTTEEQYRQSRVVNFIVCLGFAFFLVCLTPLLLHVKDTSSSLGVNFIPQLSTRAAALASTLPLIFDCIGDITLPHRIIFPRFILILSTFIPNGIGLLLVLANANTEFAEQLLTNSSLMLFICSLSGCIASEVVNKKLLYVLASVTIFNCLTHTYLAFKFAYATIDLPPTLLSRVLLCVRLSLVPILLGSLRDMKTLDRRRKMYALIYAAALMVWIVAPLLVNVVMFTRKQTYSIADVNLIFMILIASFVAIVPSRMAQQDALSMMVSNSIE
jgi:hypothetical protein